MLNLEAVGKRLSRRNARKADAWNSIHLVGQDNAVPMNRSGLAKLVRDANRHRLTLSPAQGWCRKRSIDRCRHARLARKVHGGLGDHQIELVTLQHRRGPTDC